MHKKGASLGTVVLLTFSAVSIMEAEDVLIHFHLFKGSWAEGHPGLKETEVLTASSHPAMEGLKSELDVPQDELTAAAIDALIEARELKTVDDYFVFAENWTGREGVFSRDIKHELYRFKFVYVPKRLSPLRMELKVTLHKANEAAMDKLLDSKLMLDFDDPVIVGMPAGQEAFFLMIYAKKPSELQESGGREAAKSGAEPGAPIKAPKVIYTLMPAYPEELRQQGVQGEVGLQVIIDEKGAVMEVRVTNSLHPYLDFAAVQALRQWKYEPAVQSGKPISVFHDVTILFNPQTYRYFEKKAREEAGTSAGEEPSSGSILAKVLDGTAGYCRKLSGASLDFICEEKIHEIHYNFATEPQWAALAVSSRETGKIIEQTWFPQWDPKRTEKNKYVCDYLFVRKGDNLEERRIVLNDNGRKMPDRNRLLEEKRYTALNPVLAAVQILDQDRQPLFNFRLIGTENLHERKAFVIEAIPKSGNTWGVEYAKIWIDQKSFQVLKNEIQGVPLEGYDDVLRDSVHFRVRPYLLTTHTYEFEKTGIRFPSRSTIRVEYPKLGDFYGDRTLKLKIEMSYDKYKFFTVETEEIVKK